MAPPPLFALSSIETPKGVIRLAAPRNVEEFARVLYLSMRNADKLGLAVVVVAQPEGDGLSIAIRDRLRRASEKVIK